MSVPNTTGATVPQGLFSLRVKVFLACCVVAMLGIVYTIVTHDTTEVVEVPAGTKVVCLQIESDTGDSLMCVEVSP